MGCEWLLFGVLDSAIFENCFNIYSFCFAWLVCAIFSEINLIVFSLRIELVYGLSSELLLLYLAMLPFPSLYLIFLQPLRRASLMSIDCD